MISSRVGGRGRIGCRQGNWASSSSLICKCIIIIIKVESWSSRFLSPRVRSPAHTFTQMVPAALAPARQRRLGAMEKVRLFALSLSRYHPSQPSKCLLRYLASHWQ
ncbi:hypothetical protein VFPBJ_08683 [Purpureocillium lilacinum]|uniref:Uncharacterized protein n=1 Tax=Purpureocillium lilacinum TaxID=33203 RepID=A0A179GG25_PURLI|nr:hypothetical protein VFPBJ_08683 [Purpureocillium lilacinum]